MSNKVSWNLPTNNDERTRTPPGWQDLHRSWRVRRFYMYVRKAGSGEASNDWQPLPARAYAQNLKMPHNRFESHRSIKDSLFPSNGSFFCFFIIWRGCREPQLRVRILPVCHGFWFVIDWQTSYEIRMWLHGTPKGCNTIGVFPRRFFSSGHAPPMLLVPTQSQIRIMKIPVNGTPEFARLFQSLNKTEQIFKELDVILETLAENPKLGELVRFELIPKPLQKKYPDLDNLLRVKVNKSWRLLYTLVGWPQNKTVYVLMAMPHKEYDRLFGYWLFQWNWVLFQIN